ncbi:hypothetical protein WL1483_394 [Aeromonas schubertii]|uniref:Uncharacterized protein n=1 Tax=Aeromonas schubertii TaxID=652 RepID=A0A0S2SDL5_9GAMM|nr:hypothetical protein WL1483_394 [Aeromonas schubertii]
MPTQGEGGIDGLLVVEGVEARQLLLQALQLPLQRGESRAQLVLMRGGTGAQQ